MRNFRRKSRFLFCVLALVFVAGQGGAQTSADDHAAHHPGAGSSATATGTMATPMPKAGATAGSAAGMGGMGKMMEGMMGGERPKDLYPSLMDVPNMTPDQRVQVERMAQERMRTSLAQMSAATLRAANASARNDFRESQAATEQLREATAQFESGVAAHRALTEGQNPRSVALTWFKREMNLLPPVAEPGRTRSFIPSFHTIALAILAIFAGAMIGMYFFKMRRASELLTALTASGPTTGGMPNPQMAPNPVVGGSPVGRWNGSLRVVRIFQETPEVKTFRLMSPDGAPLPFAYLPGQFLTLSVELDGKPVKRSYTIASSPTERDYVEVTVKEEVAHRGVSFHLHEVVREGDDLTVAGPSGKFTFTGTEAQSIVLIAGGVGITPMMSVIRFLTARGWRGDFFLFLCCRTERDIIFREELEYLRRRYPNFRLFITLSKASENWAGLKGRLTKEVIAQSVPDVTTHRFHICGPAPFMEAVEEMLAELGVPKAQVKTEAFGAAQPVPQAVNVGDTPSGTSPATPSATVQPATVQFARSGKSAPLSPDKTILEVAEEVGVSIDYSCRVGTCGTCIVKLLSGAVTMEVEDGLSPQDKAQQMILACQAKSSADVAVEA